MRGWWGRRGSGVNGEDLEAAPSGGQLPGDATEAAAFDYSMT
jgi:hypothetical protein